MSLSSNYQLIRNIAHRLIKKDPLYTKTNYQKFKRYNVYRSALLNLSIVNVQIYSYVSDIIEELKFKNVCQVLFYHMKKGNKEGLYKRSEFMDILTSIVLDDKKRARLISTYGSWVKDMDNKIFNNRSILLKLIVKILCKSYSLSSITIFLSEWIDSCVDFMNYILKLYNNDKDIKWFNIFTLIFPYLIRYYNATGTFITKYHKTDTYISPYSNIDKYTKLLYTEKLDEYKICTIIFTTFNYCIKKNLIESARKIKELYPEDKWIKEYEWNNMRYNNVSHPLFIENRPIETLRFLINELNAQCFDTIDHMFINKNNIVCKLTKTNRGEYRDPSINMQLLDKMIQVHSINIIQTNNSEYINLVFTWVESALLKAPLHTFRKVIVSETNTSIKYVSINPFKTGLDLYYYYISGILDQLNSKHKYKDGFNKEFRNYMLNISPLKKYYIHILEDKDMLICFR